MIYHRNWKDWWNMYWKIHGYAKFSDTNIEYFELGTTRFWIVAMFKQTWYYRKYSAKYSNAEIDIIVDSSI